MQDGFVSPGALIEDLLGNAAHETARAILSQHYPDHLDEATDAGIRERFPILLSPRLNETWEPLVGHGSSKL